jgi:hypothetical protein
MGEMKNGHKILVGKNSKERNHLGNQGEDGNSILKFYKRYFGPLHFLMHQNCKVHEMKKKINTEKNIA